MAQQKHIALTGGFAVGEAFRQIDPDVVAMYPITPQTPIMEYFAKQVANGKAQTELITVESEHSAMSACIGAAAAGARSMTASSSQGIMYMMELLPIASAMRLPIVMAVANRAISGPLNIHGDHSDAMAMRDYGWIQLFAETVQEAYDNLFIALRLAEQHLLPAASNMDGFFTSHSVENISLLDDLQVRDYIGTYAPQTHLFDFQHPKTFGSLVLPNAYLEFRKQIADEMQKVHASFSQVTEGYASMTKRRYDPIEAYQVADAEKVIVAMGSACGTIKEAVDTLRAEGEKVGLLKIRLFRPFPYQAVAEALTNVQTIITLDRNLAIGSHQVLESEIVYATRQPVQSIVYGLGGRDLFESQIIDVFRGNISGQYLA